MYPFRVSLVSNIGIIDYKFLTSDKLRKEILNSLFVIL